MPALLPTNSAKFGVTGTDDLLQSRTIATKVDKKEALDKDGNVIGMAFYGKMADHTIELLGTGASAYTLGVASTAPTEIVAVLTGTVFCVDEVSIELDGEGFNKSTVKASEYVIED